MVKKLSLVLLLLVVCVTGCARTARIKRIKPDDPAAKEPSKAVTAFTVGERATFTGSWKGIPIGEATVTTEDIIAYKGFEVYKVVVVAKTSKIISQFYKVEDTLISYIDTKDFTSRHCEAIRREGRYKKDVIVDYDFDKRLAIYNNLLDGTVKTCPIKERVHDPISAAYYFRTVPMKLGDELHVTVNVNEENYDVYGKIEKKCSITIPGLEKHEALLIKPYIKAKGKRQRRASTWGYISTGEKRLPLYGVIKILEIPWIGDISGTIKKVEYLGDNIPKTESLIERE